MILCKKHKKKTYLLCWVAHTGLMPDTSNFSTYSLIKPLTCADFPSEPPQFIYHYDFAISTAYDIVCYVTYDTNLLLLFFPMTLAQGNKPLPRNPLKSLVCNEFFFYDDLLLLRLLWQRYFCFRIETLFSAASQSLEGT